MHIPQDLWRQMPPCQDRQDAIGNARRQWVRPLTYGGCGDPDSLGGRRHRPA